jgi:hypothetical protein
MKITTISTAATALNVATTVTVATTIVFNLGISPAQAFSGFDFKTKYSQGGMPFNPKKDIHLDSVTIDSHLVSDFTFVTRAVIHNNAHTLGPISSDHGDDTVADLSLTEGDVAEQPTVDQIVTSLGNRNLNSILDSEDDAEASLDLFFDKAPTPLPTHLFFFERGLNSDLMVQLLNASGGLIANSDWTIDRSLWKDAGYSINTTEIVDAQQVGTYGLRHDAGIAGIRITSHASFNGPDFKVVGGNLQPVPAPSMLLGLGFFLRGAIKSRRKPQ